MRGVIEREAQRGFSEIPRMNGNLSGLCVTRVMQGAWLEVERLRLGHQVQT